MRICQISDTHLGYSEYGKISARSGLNQREQDFYDAWDQAIERIIALQPDLVIHAGDLFHTPRPSNRAIRVALEGIHRISNSGIPMVLVSGNHETPRIRSTGSIFESLDLFPDVFSVYDGRYQRLSFGALDVHAIPHCSLSEELEAACRSVEIRAEAQANILVTHGVWTRTGNYSMGEFNEQRLPDLTALYPGVFDHVALGHYHRRLDVAPGVSYCGATERTSLNQAGYSCGFLEVDLGSGERRYHELAVRPMIRLEPVDCHGISLQGLYERVADRAGEVPAGAIAQLTLESVEENLYLALEMRRLDDLFPEAFHLEKQLHVASAAAAAPAATLHFDTLSVEFGRYLAGQPEMPLDRERLLQLGSRYLEENEE